MLPKKLQDKLDKREQAQSLRILGVANNLVDFSSNDYLGFSKNKSIFKAAAEIVTRHHLQVNGATGSRLLSGNHEVYSETEKIIATFHSTEAALILNSGYDANLGFFSSVPQRGDIILYDELCHASIRDGITMSNAKAFKFQHNDVKEIEKLLTLRTQSRTKKQEIYVVTESVFSMDGDQPHLDEMASLCKQYNALLVLDEAHALGVVGNRGEGLAQQLGFEKDVFARIVTFGKALGCHGAAILGSADLKTFLINFARSFIYTTGLPPHTVATIQGAYTILQSSSIERKQLKSNIAILHKYISQFELQPYFISSNSAIHSCIIGGNEKTKNISKALATFGFDVKPILSPTVPQGQERLRICVHSYNTEDQIKQLLTHLNTLLKT